MKKFYMTAIVCVMLFSAACGKTGEETPTPSPTPSEEVSQQTETSVSTRAAEEQGIVRTDENGLVKVHIIDGEAFLSFDQERWDELYNMTAFAQKYYYDPAWTFGDGTEVKLFPIVLQSGKVKDAAVAQSQLLDYMQYPDFLIPSVVLLMEDGGMEWLLANPFFPGQGEVMQEAFYSDGRLPWVENAVSLSVEPDTEAPGDRTFIATDAAGTRIDLRQPCHLTNVFTVEWCATLITYEDDPSVVGWLRLSPDGSAAFRVGYWESDLLEEWVGRYEVDLREPRRLTFDLDIAARYFEGGDDESLPQTMQGTYWFSASYWGVWEMQRNEGDAICPTFVLDDENRFYFQPVYDDDGIMAWDEEGLVMVTVVDGEPVVELDMEYWDELYGIHAIAKEFGGTLMNGRRTVAGLGGKVADVVIGKVEAVDMNMYYDFIRPAVFLLMEDGTVEWFFAEPISDGEIEYTSYGKLPWIEDIYYLEYAQDDEGTGEEHTVYAYSGNGERFDLRVPCTYWGILEASWLCVLDEDTTGRLFLREDGTCTFEMNTDGQEAQGRYEGTFAVALTDGQRLRPGMISFDLSYVWDADAPNGVGDSVIQGDYFLENMPEGFNLFHSEGDSLYGESETFSFVFQAYAP